MNSNTPKNESYNLIEQHCPICEVAPTKRIGMRGGLSHRLGIGIESEVWACGSCGLIFPNPMPVPVGGLGQHYDVDANEYFINHDTDIRYQSAINLIEKAETLLGRKGRFLDIGVGRGEIVAAAKDRGWEVEGVEPSLPFAEHVEKKYGIKVLNKPIEQCELESEQYDVVILSAVLEHLYDPNAVIAEISRILIKGGIVFLDVPNERGLYFIVGNLYQKLRLRSWTINLAPTFSPFHLFGFSPRSLKMLLSKHGLEPIDWRVYGGTSLVSNRGGFIGTLETMASRAVTSVSNMGELGTYIETWAKKS